MVFFLLVPFGRNRFSSGKLGFSFKYKRFFSEKPLRFRFLLIFSKEIFQWKRITVFVCFSFLVGVESVWKMWIYLVTKIFKGPCWLVCCPLVGFVNPDTFWSVQELALENSWFLLVWFLWLWGWTWSVFDFQRYWRMVLGCVKCIDHSKLLKCSLWKLFRI